MSQSHTWNYHHAPSHHTPNHLALNHHALNHHASNHHASNHHASNYHASNHHPPNHYTPNHLPNHPPNHPPNHHPPNHTPNYPPNYPPNHPPNHLQLTQDYLNDGYISCTFGSQVAQAYLIQLFNINAAPLQATRQNDNAFYVFHPPTFHIQPAILLNGQHAWLLDHAVRSAGGSVVPQQFWCPQGQGDRRRYVEQAHLRMPVFFVNANGNLGVPVMNAAAGDMQLQGVPFPPQLIDKKTVKLRINVCTRFLPIPHHLLYVSQWPGYNLPEQQVQLRDQTPQKNLISFEKFVKHVGSRVRQYLSVRLFQM